MKKGKRILIISSLFIIPLLSLGQDVPSISHHLSKVGANYSGTGTSLGDGFILLLALIFSYEVYKFYLNEKKAREVENQAE